MQHLGLGKFSVFGSLLLFDLHEQPFTSIIYRSSHHKCSLRQGVLGNFAKFTGKHLCQSLSFNKVRPATLLKKSLWHSCEFCEFLKTPFLPFFLGDCFCI